MLTTVMTGMRINYVPDERAFNEYSNDRFDKTNKLSSTVLSQ